MSSYNNCLDCGIPVSSGEHGSYCPSHRINSQGCCQNHCLIDEEGGHCIHCTGYNSLLYCQECGIPVDLEYSICPTCMEENTDTSEEEIDEFHESYQDIAPTREEQLQRLSTLNIQLCEDCQMPCEYIWCKDCWF